MADSLNGPFNKPLYMDFKLQTLWCRLMNEKMAGPLLKESDYEDAPSLISPPVKLIEPPKPKKWASGSGSNYDDLDDDIPF